MLVAEDRPVRQLADDPLQALIALQRDVLRVVVADAAEAAPQLARLDRRTA